MTPPRINRKQVLESRQRVDWSTIGNFDTLCLPYLVRQAHDTDIPPRLSIPAFGIMGEGLPAIIVSRVEYYTTLLARVMSSQR